MSTENFSKFNLPDFLQKSLNKMGFEKPTSIQEMAIPVMLDGKDILGSAKTGTGKTGAFLIPLITKLAGNTDETALIMTPTRELAKQVFDVANHMLGRDSYINTALLIGGAPMDHQFRQLSRRPRLIVGTPGRINDHLGRNGMLFSKTRYLILDETDLMLDMGFSVQIDQILEYVPTKRQTLLFSATLPPEIMSMAKKYLVKPERIAVGSTEIRVADNIVQSEVYVEEVAKYDALKKSLDETAGTIIVFARTKMRTEKIADKLRKEQGYRVDVDYIHGGLRQGRRNRVISDFRRKRHRIMIATDVAARGLDIPHISHVINYDMPQSLEDYVHRVGRTARADSDGSALSIIAKNEKPKWLVLKAALRGEKVDHRAALSQRGGGRRRSGGGGRSSNSSYAAKRSGGSRGGSGRSGGYGRSEGSSSRGGDSRGGYGRSSEGSSSRGGSSRGGSGRSGGYGRSSEGSSSRSSDSRGGYGRSEGSSSRGSSSRGGSGFGKSSGGRSSGGSSRRSNSSTSFSRSSAPKKSSR